MANYNKVERTKLALARQLTAVCCTSFLVALAPSAYADSGDFSLNAGVAIGYENDRWQRDNVLGLQWDWQQSTLQALRGTLRSTKDDTRLADLLLLSFRTESQSSDASYTLFSDIEVGAQRVWFVDERWPLIPYLSSSFGRSDVVLGDVTLTTAGGIRAEHSQSYDEKFAIAPVADVEALIPCGDRTSVELSAAALPFLFGEDHIRFSSGLKIAYELSKDEAVVGIRLYRRRDIKANITGGELFIEVNFL